MWPMYTIREPKTISVLQELYPVQLPNNGVFFSEGSRQKRSRILAIRCVKSADQWQVSHITA